MAQKLIEGFQKIRGVGIIVQINETAITKRKYNVGRILKNQQYKIIDGINKEGNFFFKISQYRSRDLLENIIIENVKEGSTI